MDEKTSTILKKNLKEYLELAKFAYDSRKFNGAVTLYYKALVEICDLELLNKVNRIGANHTERFLLLKSNSPELYEIASKLFRFYRDSYVGNIPLVYLTSGRSPQSNYGWWYISEHAQEPLVHPIEMTLSRHATGLLTSGS